MVNPDGNGQSKVRDLGLAAALVSSGHTIVATEHDDSGRVYFIFQENRQIVKATADYWADTLLVKARTYNDSIKMLKSRIYAGRGA